MVMILYVSQRYIILKMKLIDLNIIHVHFGSRFAKISKLELCMMWVKVGVQFK